MLLQGSQQQAQQQENPYRIQLAGWVGLFVFFDVFLYTLVSTLAMVVDDVVGPAEDTYGGDWSVTGHLFAITAALLTGLGLQSLCKRREAYQFFRRLGIPGPRPHIIKGNGDRMRNPNLLPIEVMDEWQAQFGDIYGYFVGMKPYVVVSDLDVVQQVLISDFHKFVNRPAMGIELRPVINTLVGLRGQRWKEVRNVISPTFSRRKLRRISLTMQRCVDVMVDVVGKHAAEQTDMDFYSAFQGLTCQVIAECALDTAVDCQRQPDEPFLNSLRQFMNATSNPIIDLAIYFPIVREILAVICRVFSPTGQFTQSIIDRVQRAIDLRREDPACRHNDMLQLMLDAAENKATDQSDSDNSESPSPAVAPSGSLLRRTKYLLSDDEIIANAWVFLLGGFETTANSLAYCAYLLATNPDVQDKVYQELVDHFVDLPTNAVADYDTISQLTYLDQVFCETLRLFPPVVLFVNREASEETKLGKYTIPAGTNVQIPVWQIHHDPNLWPDPFRFDPDRFEPELRKSYHPMAFIPFGAGPRACLGIRFALLEAKIALAKLLIKYRLVPCSRTEEKPTVSVLSVTLNPKEGVWLRVEPRNGKTCCAEPADGR